MEFKKIQLNGFKSFAEKTDFLIEEGLTGIVGPNGCGKSNLVEAFRFVMGELSPKQMRGSELDDVIFNGTSDRPAWDIAEVTIDLDNSERKAPSLFNQNDENPYDLISKKILDKKIKHIVCQSEKMLTIVAY